MKIFQSKKEAANRRLLLGVLLLLGIFLTGCSGQAAKQQAAENNAPPLPHSSLQNPPEGALLLSLNTDAADALAAQALKRLGSGNGIMAASLVEMDNLERSSLFGQTTSQQIGSRLSQHGFKVLESRLGAELRLQKQGGEFMLTRESTRLLAQNHDAHAALLGTYSESGGRLFVSVRLVRLSDNAVIAAYEYYVPKRGDVLAMLNPASRSQPGTHSEVWARQAQREPAFDK